VNWSRLGITDVVTGTAGRAVFYIAVQYDRRGRRSGRHPGKGRGRAGSDMASVHLANGRAAFALPVLTQV